MDLFSLWLPQRHKSPSLPRLTDRGRVNWLHAMPIWREEIAISGGGDGIASIQLSETSNFATALARFCSMLPEGGKPSLLHLSMDLTSFTSCCGLSNCRLRVFSAFERVRRLCLSDNVVRSNSNIFATWGYDNYSSPLWNSRNPIASWIRSMVVELWRDEVVGISMLCCSGRLIRCGGKVTGITKTRLIRKSKRYSN